MLRRRPGPRAADELPPVEGLARLWGRGVYHGPYCHGWEVRDQPVAVLGGDDDAAYLALNLARLGCDVVLCTDGDAEASEPARATLRAHGVRVCEELVLGVTVPQRLAGKGALAWSERGRGHAYAPTVADEAGLAVADVLRTYGDAAVARFAEAAGADPDLRERLRKLAAEAT